MCMKKFDAEKYLLTKQYTGGGGGYQVSRTYCQVSLLLNFVRNICGFDSKLNESYNLPLFKLYFSA